MELEFKYRFMLISFIASSIAYTEHSYILIDEHVAEHKHKWDVAVRKQVFIELKKRN